MTRPGWDEYFMEITRLVARRSTCLRRQVGAVVVKDKNILASGYNGVPTGITHCAETGCLRAKLNVPSGERHELCRGLHAEQNAIIQAARHGTNIDGATLYSTTMPCIICVKFPRAQNRWWWSESNPAPDNTYGKSICYGQDSTFHASQ